MVMVVVICIIITIIIIVLSTRNIEEAKNKTGSRVKE